MAEKINRQEEVGRGYVITACRNVGLKTATAYYKALNNKKAGLPLSIDQKAVLREYKRLITED